MDDSVERLLSVTVGACSRVQPELDDGATADRAAAAEGEAPNRKAATMRTHLLVKVILGTMLYLTVQLMALYLLARTLVSGLFGLP